MATAGFHISFLIRKSYSTTSSQHDRFCQKLNNSLQCLSGRRTLEHRGLAGKWMQHTPGWGQQGRPRVHLEWYSHKTAAWLKTAHQQNANHTLNLPSKNVTQLQLVDSPSTLARKEWMQISCKKTGEIFSTLTLVQSIPRSVPHISHNSLVTKWSRLPCTAGLEQTWTHNFT